MSDRPFQQGQPFYRSGRNAALFEPRIELVRKQLLSLLSVVDLERDGEVVTVDGFRLKNLRDWVVPSSGDPLEVFGYAGSRCNVDCVFCYHKGDPPTLALGHDCRPTVQTGQEMETRLKYYSSMSRSALFPSLGNTGEVLAHQDILDILAALRQKTERPFRITTNGRLLTASMVRALSELKPVYLYLSLHSASAVRRKELLNDGKARVAIDALPLIREAQIPYAAVIVPWPTRGRGVLRLKDAPTSTMVDDLGETILYADAYDPHLIEVHLPGYSRYFSNEKLFDREETWSAIVDCVGRLREQARAPIVVMPSMYEENLHEKRANLPKIIGLIKNSPAANAGLAHGDLIMAVEGSVVSSRPQARDLLSLVARSGREKATLEARRGAEALTFELALNHHGYPYDPAVTAHLGIIMMGTGLRPSALESLKQLIEERKARRILFLTSTLMKPGFQQALRESLLFAAPDLSIELAVPRNNFFGGNIIMGDLLVVEDFVACVEEYLAAGNPRPELVVIPSSPFNLGRFKRDLTGRVYLDVERQLGIPVALLDCETIFD
ncbi:MAG: radical SAM protein [Chloroflexi bacterium]|nr:radical SAM protein [Chloroflexota bacterium]